MRILKPWIDHNRASGHSGQESKMTTISQIRNAANTNELSSIVEAYLAGIGETENARGESYAETAARLGGDEILEAAESRWFELGA